MKLQYSCQGVASFLNNLKQQLVNCTSKNKIKMTKKNIFSST